MELRELILRARAEGVEIAQRKYHDLAQSVSGGLDSMRTKTVGLTAAFSGLFSIWTAKQAFTGLVETNRSMEKLFLALKTTTGGISQANEQWMKLEKFAATTPYTLDQSVEAFIKLKNLGLDPSEEAMRSYGDTASAMGKDLTQFIEAVADAVTGENERLKEFGIKASQSGDSVSYTFRGVTTTVKKSADEIQRYLIDLGNKNFFGAMSDQMSGLGGKLSNLEDSFNRMKYAIGKGGFSEAVGEASSKLADFFSEFVSSGKAEQVGTALGKGLQFATDKATVLIDKLAELTTLDFSQSRVLWFMDQLVAGAEIATARISRFYGQVNSMLSGDFDQFMSDELDKSFYDSIARAVIDRPNMLKQYSAKYPIQMQSALARLEAENARKTDLRSWIAGIRNKDAKTTAATTTDMTGSKTTTGAAEQSAKAIKEANKSLEIYKEYMADLFGTKEEIAYKSRLMGAAEEDRSAIELEWQYLKDWGQIQAEYEKAYNAPGMTEANKKKMADAVTEIFQLRRDLYKQELAKDKADKSAQEFDSYWQGLTGEAASVNNQFDPRLAYSERLSKLSELSQSGLISVTTEAKAVAEATRQLEETDKNYWIEHGSWIDGAKIALSDYREEISKTSKHVYESFSRALSATEDAFVQFSTTGKFSFQSLIQSIQADMVRIAYKNTIGKLLTSAMDTIFSGFGQNYAAPGALPGRALGGPVYAGSAYIVGERGPEIFAPRQSGTIIPNSSPVINITQNFNSNPSKQTAKQAAREAADFVGRKLSRL